MTAAATFARLRDLGVTVRADGGALRLRPASAVPADLLAEVRANKADMLALLAANDATTLARLRAACDDRAAALAGAYDAPDVLADREAIAAEEPLPAPGTPERQRHDQSLGAKIAGLIRGYHAHRTPTPSPKLDNGESA